jgi:hypothetical protein
MVRGAAVNWPITAFGAGYSLTPGLGLAHNLLYLSRMFSSFFEFHVPHVTMHGVPS